MSTTIVTTWATDIAQLGPVYPFAGSEFLLWVLGLIFWLGFHFLQTKAETRSLRNEESDAESNQDIVQQLLTEEVRVKK